MKTKLHAFAGGIALLTIGLFWTATVWSEVLGDQTDIMRVKAAILWGMALLVPSMMIVGGSGFALAAGRVGKLIDRKKVRMRIVALNGLLVLLPSAVFLAGRAQAGTFDIWFYAVQGAELLAGALNITLLALNMKDGFAMTRRQKRFA
jgi:hypothetical protein